MLISFNWLKQYVNLPSSIKPEEVAERLKMSTVEVEKIIYRGADLKKIFVGKVLKAEKHPSADRLKKCLVDAGNEKLNIVCGGSNVAPGILVAVAGVGARVKWHGGEDFVVIEPTKIRGEESHGMICASEEIGLSEFFPSKEEKEILDLTGMISDDSVGKPLAEVLGFDDVVLEIDNKSLSHRPDLWGHYGLAREVAVLFRRDLGIYHPPEIKTGKESKIKVEVEDSALCPRYMAVAVSGVKVSSSPSWLQARLMAAGQRPINNIVDITNYIMMDLGQPMHAFDAKKLSGKNESKKIIIRAAESEEKLLTLDNEEKVLPKDALVIADEDKILAIAGVKGGVYSGISEDTETIIFESANFNCSSVRKTSIALGLRTESSARFEKGLDPTLAELALKRAVQMVLELCPDARVTSAVADCKDFALNRGPIIFSPEIARRKLGMEISEKDIKDILIRLGFVLEEKKKQWKVFVPSWRAGKDVSLPEDLAEEIARVRGFDIIPSQLPSFSINPAPINRLRLLERKIKELAVLEQGFCEVYNYSFMAPEWLAKVGTVSPLTLELANPLAKDRPFLRRSLLPGLLHNAEKNSHVRDELRLFEIGKIYQSELAGEREERNNDALLPRQDSIFSAVYTAKNEEQPFYQLSALWSRLAKRLGIAYQLDREKIESEIFTHPGRRATVLVNGEKIGLIAEVLPSAQKNVGLPWRAAVLEINLNILSKFDADLACYQSLSAYPLVDRDLAFTVSEKIEHRELAEVMKENGNFLRSVELFDVYRGKELPAGTKSMAYRMVFGSNEKTLSSKEVDDSISKIIKALEKKFDAEIRK